MCAKILISPLDWGLGHATRMIPVITWLSERNHEVYLASYGESGNYLRKEFPALKHFHLPGFSVKYSSGNYFYLNVVAQLPALQRQLNHERREAGRLCAFLKPDLIISDNRYGVNNSSTYSVLITHQTNILVPKLFRPIISSISNNLINRFDECWIPDTSNNDYSGDLSHTKGLSCEVRHIGLLSTITGIRSSSSQFDICMLVSGPEPQRGIFLDKLCRFAAENRNLKVALLTSCAPSATITENVTLFVNADRRTVKETLFSSELLIGRSGYSTIMDVAGTGIKALFIPTPGQSEQEWLADHFKESGIALCKSQREEITFKDVQEALRYKGFQENADKSAFISELQRLGL